MVVTRYKPSSWRFEPGLAVRRPTTWKMTRTVNGTGQINKNRGLMAALRLNERLARRRR